MLILLFNFINYFKMSIVDSTNEYQSMLLVQNLVCEKARFLYTSLARALTHASGAHPVCVAEQSERELEGII